jgi:hypothetical protein
MAIPQSFMNAVLMLVHPEQYMQGVLARRSAQSNPDIVGHNPAVTEWPSVMSGVSLIMNRKTPEHRDRNGHRTGYDLLLSLGSEEDVTLDLGDLGASLPYSPGTVNAICGRILTHSVKEWDRRRDRICYAHWLRECMLQRTGSTDPFLTFSTVDRCQGMLGLKRK